MFLNLRRGVGIWDPRPCACPPSIVVHLCVFASQITDGLAAVQLRDEGGNATPIETPNRLSLSLNRSESAHSTDVDIDIDDDDSDDDSDMMAALGILDEVAEADAAIDDVLTTMMTITEDDEITAGSGLDRQASSQSTDTADTADSGPDDDDLEDGLKPAVMQRKIAASVRRGQVSQDTALVAVQWVDNEIRKLAKFIQDHGTVRDCLLSPSRQHWVFHAHVALF